MKPVENDYFADKAKDYDIQNDRSRNIDNIIQGIFKEISFSKEMRIMDFGSGTGLLLERVAPFVGSVSAIDVSPAMNDVLRSKLDEISCVVEIHEMDLTKENLEGKFDSIISSMTLHHIDDIGGLFDTFYGLLERNGIIAIADLDKEDGSFHDSNEGVFHFGFERNEFLKYAEDAGFRDLKIQTVSSLEKPTSEYPVFLLTGRK